MRHFGLRAPELRHLGHQEARCAAHNVTAEVDGLLDASSDALALMTFSEMCRCVTEVVAAQGTDPPAALYMPSSCATVHALAIEGGVLLQNIDGRWAQRDILDLDPGEP